MENVFARRIELLRDLMDRKGWDAVILTGSDPHASEYPASRWKQVEWLTGFTGEAGDVVVTRDHAGLWTDTRYFIQAVSQLEGTGVVLHKTRVLGQVLIPEWLDGQFPKGGVVALDGLCFTSEAAQDLPEKLEIISVPDILSSIWEGRPQIPQTPVFTIEAGESRNSKISWLRELLVENGCDGILLSSLDEVAWTLNVRASDIEYNPLVISYLLVTRDAARWYVEKDDEQDPETSRTFARLSEEGISVERYSDVLLGVNECDRLWVDPSSLNYHLSSSLICEVVEKRSPVALRKAVKNEFEIESMRAAHIKDGVAVEKFLYWLEKSLNAGKTVSEWDAAVKLGHYRLEIDDYRGDSFETISAYGKGAALPHYITPHNDAPVLEQSGLYLCDSGGQYLQGTTDITRTIPLGPLTELEAEDYTLVLKGHIDLAMAVFPFGTSGCQIDALAREPLWRFRRSFGHGTGHGVGFFLGCHEGPQDIRQNHNSQPMLPGMITSNEPGIYREGLHGVRHENLLLCVELEENEFGRWLGFEPLTMCHFDTSALATELLSQEEIDWLNAYNQKVFETLSPLLPQDVADWLRQKTHCLIP